MNKRNGVFWGGGLGVFFTCLAFGATLATSKPAGKIETLTLDLDQEVDVLRTERKQKMPYLDSRSLRESINPQAVEAKHHFLTLPSKQFEDILQRAAHVYTRARASKERVSLGKRRALVAARDLLPEADFNFELEKGSLSADAFTSREYHTTFRIPVFRGGVLWNTFQQARAEHRAAQREYEAVLDEMVDEVAQAYFELLRAQEVYQDKVQTTGLAENYLKISQVKFDKALISEIESLNVESMAGQLQYDVETAEQELELAKLGLERFLGLGVGDHIEIDPLYDIDELIERAAPGKAPGEKGVSERVLDQTLDALIDLAYQNRPDLKQEAELLSAARYEEKASRGAFKPHFDLTLEFGELGESFIRDADDPAHQPEWRLGFELSQNLLGSEVKYVFDNDENAPSVTQFQQGTGSQVTRRRMEIGFLNRLDDYVEAQETKVGRLEQLVELEEKEQEVIREVKEAYFDYEKARIQVQSSLKRNQYRRRLAQLSKLRLDKAEVEISEYLQAEIDHSEERKNLHGALADFFKAKSKLNRSIGVRNYLPLEERYGV